MLLEINSLWLIFALGLIAIFVVGIVLMIRGSKATDGEFIIDTSDPKKDIYRLELGNELENLSKKKVIKLKVVYGRISQ